MYMIDHSGVQGFYGCRAEVRELIEAQRIDNVVLYKSKEGGETRTCHASHVRESKAEAVRDLLTILDNRIEELQALRRGITSSEQSTG